MSNRNATARCLLKLHDCRRRHCHSWHRRRIVGRLSGLNNCRCWHHSCLGRLSSRLAGPILPTLDRRQLPIVWLCRVVIKHVGISARFQIHFFPKKLPLFGKRIPMVDMWLERLDMVCQRSIVCASVQAEYKNRVPGPMASAFSTGEPLPGFSLQCRLLACGI